MTGGLRKITARGRDYRDGLLRGRKTDSKNLKGGWRRKGEGEKGS